VYTSRDRLERLSAEEQSARRTIALMARGGKISRSHNRVQRGERDGASDADSSDEEAQAPSAARAKLGGQPATAGMMPPSDSDEDEEEEEKEKAPAGKSGQPATAGKLPPTSDDDDEEDEEEDDDEDDDDEDDKARPAAQKCVLSTPSPCASLALASLHSCRGGAPERTEKEIAQDLARLELIRKKRCGAPCAHFRPVTDCPRNSRADAAAERIAKEGFDRFAPK
jgi:hypothetical protein